ncbi:Neutral/alkaline non-lysosomal ceramidase-domain-containing protein [Mycena vitilis]|nr:Neutral/alkaline non-lysosomal ceramidase-domain-containing protein [Mycena vitilis]
MSLLSFGSRGFLSWFPVHGTSIYENNTLVSSDNKGMAAYLYESSIEPNAMPGNQTFVAGFAQANVSDTSPNTLGAFCESPGKPYDGQPCQANSSTCGGTVEDCHGRGPGFTLDSYAFHSNEMIAQIQVDAAKSLVGSNLAPVTGSVRSVHVYLDRANHTFTLPNGTTVGTCPAAMEPTMLPTPTPPFPPQSRTAHALHARTLSWFLDAPAAPFGPHCMALARKAAGTDVEMWFGPSAAAGALRTLVDAFPACGLGVSVATDGTLYQTEIFAASHSPAASSSATSVSSSGSHDHGKTSSHGHGRQTDAGRPPAIRMRTRKHGRASGGSTGVAAAGDSTGAGRSTYVSPSSRTANGQTLAPAEQAFYAGAYSAAELRTFHSERVRKMPLGGLDPRMLIGSLPRTICSIQDEPPTSPGADDDDVMGLESVSDPEEEDLVDDGDISSASYAPSSSVSHDISRASHAAAPTFSHTQAGRAGVLNLELLNV